MTGSLMAVSCSADVTIDVSAERQLRPVQTHCPRRHRGEVTIDVSAERQLRRHAGALRSAADSPDVTIDVSAERQLRLSWRHLRGV